VCLGFRGGGGIATVAVAAAEAHGFQAVRILGVLVADDAAGALRDDFIVGLFHEIDALKVRRQRERFHGSRRMRLRRLGSGEGGSSYGKQAEQTQQTDEEGGTILKAVCEFGPCGYNWRWEDGTRLGVNMGSGPVVAFQFPAAGWQMVTLKVSEHCFEGSARWCWRTLSQQVFVEDEAVAPE
jgi:hypothetical protein